MSTAVRNSRLRRVRPVDQLHLWLLYAGRRIHERCGAGRPIAKRRLDGFLDRGTVELTSDVEVRARGTEILTPVALHIFDLVTRELRLGRV
jgi:hypothetical protein